MSLIMIKKHVFKANKSVAKIVVRFWQVSLRIWPENVHYKSSTLSGETFSGEVFIGLNYSLGKIFVTKQKIRHFRPTKNFAQ